MTVLNSLKLVSYSQANSNTAEATRRRKLVAKIDEQLALAANADYQPTKINSHNSTIYTSLKALLRV